MCTQRACQWLSSQCHINETFRKRQSHEVATSLCAPPQLQATLTSFVLAPSIHSASIRAVTGTSQEHLGILPILSRQLEPLITVEIMPTFGTLEAYMITEGNRMIEFDVQEETNAEGQKLVTCWVPSEAGKVSVSSRDRTLHSHDANSFSGVHPHGQRLARP